MAYRRDTVVRTPLLHWEQLVLVSAQAGWSDGYRVASPRLLLPLHGCFGCRLGGHDFVCDPGAALWLRPDEAYGTRHRGNGQRSALITLDAEFGPSRRAALPLAAHLQLGRWRRALADGTTDALGLEEEVVALLGTLLEAPATPARPHRGVERAREHIAAAPGRNDTLAEIAAAACCSPFHLARAFRARTGDSLHGFRTRLRLAQAIERLRHGEADLSGLAADLGYTSHSHFSAVFRRRVGTSPARLRAQLQLRTISTAPRPRR